MADFTALKTAIQNAIKQNGNEEITGNLLQEVLLAIVTTLGDGSINDLINALDNEATTRSQADGTLQQNINAEAQARQQGDSTLQGGINTAMQAINAINNAIGNGCVYAGIATPSTTPAAGKVFYLALTAGTYTNFNGLEVSQGINILKNNGSTWSLDSFVGIDDAPAPSSQKLVKSGGVFDEVMKNGSAFDLSAYNGGATYADLNAALVALNALPAAYKRGGMSMKFVLSSDNNYVQWRYMSSSTAVADFTNVANWQGVDEEPVAGSKNLVESGGVITSIFAKTGNVVWERGNVKLENNSIVWYDPTKQNRIRTPENAYFVLEKGTTIFALSNVQFFVYKIKDDGSITTQNWNTQYICHERGKYVFMAQYNDQSNITNVSDVADKIIIKPFELFHKTINGVYSNTTTILSDRITQGSQYNNTSANRCFYNPQEKLKVGSSFIVTANSGYRFGFAFVSILSDNKPALIAAEVKPYVGWINVANIVIPETTQSFYMVISKTDDSAITPQEAATAFTISYDKFAEQENAEVFNPTPFDIKRLADGLSDIKNTQGLVEFEYGNINFTANGADYLPISHQNTYKRIRTKNNYYIEKGSVIGLSDYTQAKYFIGCRKEDGTYYANGWLTSNFECPYSGWYDIMITHLTDITLTSVEELTSLFLLKPYSSIVRNDIGVPTSVFAGHPFYDHILVNRQTQEQQIIPCQSLAAVNLSARLGFNFIEANTIITSDGVSLTIHGENKTIDGVNGVVFPPSVHYINSDTPATDFHVATKTAQWIRENVRYYSPYSKYETYIPTLKEFCVACRENNIGVLGSFQSTDDIDIALSILGIDRVVCYRSDITRLSDWRTKYPKLTMMYYPKSSGATKDECVDNCKAVGTPFLNMLQTISNYTDSELIEIVQAIHKEGCLTGIASNYEGDEATRKAIRCGMDVFASGWQMNPFEGNLLHLRSDLDFSDYDISGDNNVISDGTLVLKSGNYLSKSYNNGQSLFVSKHNLYIRFNGTLGISLTGTGHGATEFEVTSDGTNLEFFSDFGIEKTVSFYLKAIGDVTIYEVQYDASRC